jgi:hypothetical protein
VTRSTRLSRMRPSSLARLPASSCISHSPTEPAAALLPGLLRPAPARQPPAAIARVNRVPSPSVPSPSSPFIHAVERRPDVPVHRRQSDAGTDGRRTTSIRQARSFTRRRISLRLLCGAASRLQDRARSCRNSRLWRLRRSLTLRAFACRSSALKRRCEP